MTLATDMLDGCQGRYTYVRLSEVMASCTTQKLQSDTFKLKDKEIPVLNPL